MQAELLEKIVIMNSIPFRIYKIENDPIGLHADLIENDAEIELGFEMAFNGSLSDGTVGCMTKYVFKQGECIVSSLTVYCYFVIEPKFLEKNTKDNRLIIGKDFLRYLATISVGTARGIQHAKTQGTVLNTFVIPPINLMEFEIKDLVLE